MSHILRCTASIVNPDPDLMQHSIVSLSQVKGGHVESFVLDFYGAKTTVDFAIVTKEFPRGLGVKKNGNQLEFVYDGYLCEEEAEKLKTLFLQYYNAGATQRSLAQLGYQVQTKTTEKGVYLEGLVR
jgi:hypothetical protein